MSLRGSPRPWPARIDTRSVSGRQSRNLSKTGSPRFRRRKGKRLLEMVLFPTFPLASFFQGSNCLRHPPFPKNPIGQPTTIRVAIRAGMPLNEGDFSSKRRGVEFCFLKKIARAGMSRRQKIIPLPGMVQPRSNDKIHQEQQRVFFHSPVESKTRKSKIPSS